MITADKVRTSPEALLQASEEELRALFSQVLKRRAAVEAAVQFALAWQEVAEVASSEPRDLPREVRVFNNRVLPCWKEHAPWVQECPVVDIMPGEEPGESLRFMGLTERQESSPVWACLKDKDAKNPFAEARKPTVWEQLLEIYKWKRFGRCRYCGRLMVVTRSTKRYCSSSCRAQAFQARARQSNAKT